MSVIHKTLKLGQNHAATSFSFVDAAARLAAAVTADDIDKIAYQQDTQSYYTLAAISPLKWVGVDGTNTGDVTITSPAAANTNGLSVAGQALSSTPADETHPGHVTTDTQTFAGHKSLSQGITSTGLDSGVGVYGLGGTNGSGVRGDGNGFGAGVEAFGGGTNGTGVQGTGGVTNGIGVKGVGKGTGTGVAGTSSTGTGWGVQATGNSTRAPLHIDVQAAAPSVAAEGDIYYDSSTHHFFGWTGAAWKQLDN